VATLYKKIDIFSSHTPLILSIFSFLQLCKLVSSTRSKIWQVFEEKKSLFIEVYGTINKEYPTSKQTCRVYLDKLGNHKDMVLLERWKVEILKRKYVFPLTQ